MVEPSSKAHPVGEKEPNGFGLYDTHGNVSEWVEDCIHRNYAGSPSDGSAWTAATEAIDCKNRVLRGGDWGVDARDLRSAYRGGLAPDLRSYYFGFRVARTLSATASPITGSLSEH